MTDEQITQPFETRSEKLLTAIMIAVGIIVAIWFRFNLIDIKPFHFDEGVNYNFLHNLATTGEYRYDPSNYHGPTLYYLALITLRIFGENTFALRFWPATFGVLTVTMLWFLRHHLGKVGTAVAAFCMALSPGLVYYSRDFIHEMSFGCFTLGIVIGALRYVETRKFIWLVLMSVSAALLITTKETAIVNITVLILAIISASVWVIARRLIREDRFNLAAVVKELKGDIAGVLPTTDQSLAALVIFAFIYILFYSSLFTHWEGVIDFFRSIWHWTSERSNKDHVKPFYYYLGILVKLEFPLLIGSLLGGVFVVKQGTRLWLFIAAWTLGAFLAYSIIPYKTPWLMVSFLIPMAIISGYAAQEIYLQLTSLSSKIACAAVVIIALISCWRLSSTVNFEKFDDNSNTAGYFTGLGKSMKLTPYVDGLYGYVYVQTDRDILNLVEAVKSESERLKASKSESDRLKSGKETGISLALTSGDYWPLPWYLRDYSLDYQGRLNESPGQTPEISRPLVITTVNQQYIFDGHPEWRLVERAFKLRPGVELVLYARQDVADSPQKAQNDGNRKKDGDR
jgi:uncharacterized protein (TIGR03663 family)